MMCYIKANKEFFMVCLEVALKALCVVKLFDQHLVLPSLLLSSHPTFRTVSVLWVE